jgi:hypothetical protein
MAFDMVKEYLSIDFKESDTQVFEQNDLMRGTCDILLKDSIIDVKCSWDCFTFPKYDNEVPKIDYYWQSQVYMELFNKENYKLIYCLTDMHPAIIEQEAKRYCYSNRIEMNDTIYDKFYERYTYTGFDLKDKVKVFEIKRNESDIQKIKDRVIECRNFIETLKN